MTIRTDTTYAEQLLVALKDPRNTSLPFDVATARPFALARLWAEECRRPNPLEEIERRMRTAFRPREHRATNHVIEDFEISFARAQMQDWEQTIARLRQEALPHIAAYFPPEAVVRAEIVPTLFLTSEDAFAWSDGTIVVDVSSVRFQGDPGRMYAVLAHELVHVAHSRYLKRQLGLNVALQPSQLLGNMRFRLHAEGLATHIAWRFKPEDERNLDAIAAGSRLRVEMRILNAIAAEIAALRECPKNAELDSACVKGVTLLRQRLTGAGFDGGAFYSVGAHMAESIEVFLGRPALTKTISEGPEAFLAAYRSIEERVDGVPRITLR